MMNSKKKLLTAALALTLSFGGLSGLPVLPAYTADAASVTGALIQGAVAMAYVKSSLVKMDNEGQAESLKRTQAQTGYYQNEAYQQRVQNILANLKKTGLVKRDYAVYVNPEKDFNAFMTIGAVMSLNKGALDALDDNELAYVMAHEIAHGEKRHVISGVEKAIGLQTAINVYAAGSGGSALLGNLVGNYLNNQVFTMGQEKEADDLGFKILAASSYNPGGAAAAMAVLRNAYGNNYREGLNQVLAPNNHPKSSDRVTSNSERLTKYANGHVKVDGSTVYVNGVNVYTPADSGRYTGEERAYLMAGKLARLYHNNAMAGARVAGGSVYIGDLDIISTPGSDVATQVATNINGAFYANDSKSGSKKAADSKKQAEAKQKADSKAKADAAKAANKTGDADKAGADSSKNGQTGQSGTASSSGSAGQGGSLLKLNYPGAGTTR